VRARVICWLTAISLGLHAVTARAASDWIDELPTVTTVAHAVREQLKVDTAEWNFSARGIALEDDDDLFAVYLVGTLVLLRKIVLFKYQEDKSLSPERVAKLKLAVAGYLEAELLIGKEIGNRRGYLSAAQKCRDIDCYRRWFKTGYSNVYISAAYRERILARLYCGDRAAQLNQLAQSYAGRTPYLPSPAETRIIDPEVAGIAPAGCSAYGGDANRDGLCDDWESSTRTTSLDGPYCSADLAVQGRAGETALRLTRGDVDSVEHGFMILRDLRRSSGGYYATPPVRTSVPRSTSGQPLFGAADFGKSLAIALRPSSKELASFTWVAAVHTHPSDLDFPFRGGPGADAIGFKNDHFSMKDFDLAISLMDRVPTHFGPGLDIQTDLEKIYVITARNGCIRAFKPQNGDRTFKDAELLLSEVPRSVDLYAKYFDREEEIHCFNPSP
jgi:hypothetical protein